MTGARRGIVGGLVAGLAAATLVAWTSAGAQRTRAAADSENLDCTSCHPNVHATMPDTGQVASGRCTACHAKAHEAVRWLYAGTGADSTIRPDRMFDARVGCRGCHTDSALAARADAPKLAAVERACTSCHGTRFEKILPRWSRSMARRIQLAEGYLTDARAEARFAKHAGAQAQLRAATADLGRVVKGRGLHNVPGSDALLRSAIRKTGAAYRVAGLQVPPPPALGPDPARVSCAYCHYGIETARDSVFGQSFDHADHVVRADVACTTCHSSANYFTAGERNVDAAHGKTTVTAAACNACHHVTSKLVCTACHAPQALAGRAEPVTLPLKLQPATAPQSREVAFRHEAHARVECTACHTSRTEIRAVVACTTCHESHHRQAADCTACHGTTLLATHTASNHLACATCHGRSTLELLTGNRAFCTSCHTDRRAHFAKRECSTCHLQMSPAQVREKILGG